MSTESHMSETEGPSSQATTAAGLCIAAAVGQGVEESSLPHIPCGEGSTVVLP